MRQEKLYLPDLDIIGVFNHILIKHFKEFNVSLVEQPDFSSWNLYENTFLENNVIVDIGGEEFAHICRYNHVKFNIKKIVADLGISNSIVLGAGACCSESIEGHKGELMVNMNLTNNQNKSISARVENKADIKCNYYYSDYYGGLGNLHISHGNRKAKLIKINLKARKSDESSLLQILRNGLNEFYKEPIGLVGIFKVKNGKIKAHVQTDLSNKLHFYETKANNLVFTSVAWTRDPTGGSLHLRKNGEHTHFFSIDGSNIGGHYHGDVSPEEIEYECYFTFADSIVRVRDSVVENLVDNEPNVSIGIVGAGAMGCLFGGLLAENGLNVTLIDTWKEHVEKINNNGLKLMGIGGERVVKVNALTDAKELKNKFDIIIIQCKSLNTREATESIKHLVKETTAVISFQNGLGNEDIISEVLENKCYIFGGQTLQGANIEEPGVVKIHTNLSSYIGNWNTNMSCNRCCFVSHIFTKANVPTFEDINIKKRLWMKVIYNCVVSPLSSILDLSHKDIYCHKSSIEIANYIIKEVLMIAQLENVNISEEEANECLNKVIESKQDNKSSMCYDILNKKKSEIDYINGYILKLAEKHKKDLPLNKTLYFFINLMENKYL